MAVNSHISAPRPIDDFEGWIAAFTQPTVLIELAVLAACVGLAWTMVMALRKSLGLDEQRSIWFGSRNIDGVLFPLLLLCLGYAALAVASRFMPVAVFKLAIPVLMSLVVIRVGVKVLQSALTQSRWVKVLEQTISWLAWLGMVLWVSGLLPVIWNELDLITWSVGGSTLSVRTGQSTARGSGSRISSWSQPSASAWRAAACSSSTAVAESSASGPPWLAYGSDTRRSPNSGLFCRISGSRPRIAPLWSVATKPCACLSKASATARRNAVP